MYHRESSSTTRYSSTKYGYPLPRALQKPSPTYAHPLVPSEHAPPRGRITPPEVPLSTPRRANVVTSHCSTTNGRLPCFMRNFQ